MKNIFNTLKNVSLFIIAISFFSISQLNAQTKMAKKYELKENTFLVDGKPTFTLTEMDNKQTGKKDVLVKNVKGERLLLFQTKETSSKTPYYEVLFLGNNSKAETAVTTDLKSLAQLISENELVKDGKLNIEAERKFISANENKFSKATTK